MSVLLTPYIVQRSTVYIFISVYVFKNEFLMIPIVPVQDSGFFLAFSFSTLVFSPAMENLIIIIQCKKLSNPTSLPLFLPPACLSFQHPCSCPHYCCVSSQERKRNGIEKWKAR